MNYKQTSLEAITAVLALLVLIQMPHAWSWSEGANYFNALNISVSDWNYSPTYGSTQWFRYGAANYALVNMTNAGNPYLFSVRGYAQDGTFVGNIVYYPAIYNSIYTTILLPNSTVLGVPWKNATIFFNPKDQDASKSTSSRNPTQSPIGKLATYAGLGGNALTFNMIYTADLKGTFNVTKTQFVRACIGNTCPSAPTNSLGIVLLTNRSIVNENFSINYAPASLISDLTIFQQNGTRYQLKNDGLFNFGLSQLSESPKNSVDANIIFGSNAGFEGYFSIPDNVILSESMYANVASGKMYNSLTSKPISLTFLPTVPAVKLVITTTNSISAVIVPAFTTNFVRGNVIANPDKNLAKSKSFLLYQAVNVTFNYTFTTFAYPTNTNSAFQIKYGSGKVPYALVSIPYQLGMGVGCYNTYVNSSDGEPIAFFTYSCNQNTDTLLISNQTAAGHLYSSFRVWFDSPDGSGGFSDVAVKNNYLFATGNSLSIPFIGNVPFEFRLNQTLGVNSFVGFPISAEPFGVYMSYNGKDFLQSNQFTGGNVLDRTTDKNKQILIDNSQTPVLYTQTLSINSVRNSPAGSLCNDYPLCENIYNISANVYVHSSHAFSAYSNVVLKQPNYANVVRLASNSYVLLGIFSGNTIASSLPTSPTRLNFTTTSIDYRHGALNQSLQVTPDLILTRWQAGLVVIIAIILLSFTIRTKENIAPVVGIIFLWLLGLWNITFFALAALISILFILYEYNQFKHKEQVHGEN